MPRDDDPDDEDDEDELYPERNEILIPNLQKIAPSATAGPENKAIKIRANDRIKGRRRPYPHENHRPGRETSYFQIISGQNNQNNQQFAGAGPVKCYTDYLLLNGMRYCGSHLNEGALYRNNIDTDVPVIDNSTGPVYARFVTSEEAVSRGFMLNYHLNPCLLNG